ncbi:MAG: hypothetical protein ACKPKO_08510, partial [Candidatus Fonsibacter sp.]
MMHGSYGFARYPSSVRAATKLFLHHAGPDTNPYASVCSRSMVSPSGFPGPFGKVMARGARRLLDSPC